MSVRSTVSSVSEQISTLEETGARRGLIGSIRRFFSDRFSDVSPSEKWGYVVWAAVAGSDFIWPTISTTVGHLEDRWPVVALLPVALIVMAGYSVFRVPPASTALQADFQALGRTPQGRLAKQDVTLDQLAGGGVPAVEGRSEFGVVRYFVVATIAVVVGALAVSPSDNRFLVGYVLYSLIGIFWVVVPNSIAYFLKKDIPFTTMFFTVRSLGRRLQFVAALVAALLVILLLHLAFYPWPSQR